jgi:cytoskeletal protein CcmA (bactofilin family)
MADQAEISAQQPGENCGGRNENSGAMIRNFCASVLSISVRGSPSLGAPGGYGAPSEEGFQRLAGSGTLSSLQISMNREEEPVTQRSIEQTGERSAVSRPPPLSSGQAAAPGSRIGPSIVIKGELTAAEDLLIMGRVEGVIDHDQTLTIHADGVVCGEVKAKNILVEGSVEGNLYAMERVRIEATGRMTGDVFAPRVGVLEGATFKGAVDMDADIGAIQQRFEKSAETKGYRPTDTAPAKADNPEPPMEAGSKALPSGESSASASTASGSTKRKSKHNDSGESDVAQASEHERLADPAGRTDDHVSDGKPGASR